MKRAVVPISIGERLKRRNVVIPGLLAVALAGCGGGGGSGGGGGVTPATPTTLSIATLSATGTLAANGTYTLVVTESGGGQTFSPGTLTYTLSNPAVGTLSAGTLKTGVVNATGTITVSDSSRGLSTTITVRVGTTHPATNGDAVALAGTLTERITRPLPDPVATQPPYGFSYAVSIASTTSTGKAFGTQTGLIDFTTVETDTGSTPPLPVTTTDTYESLVNEATGTIDVISPGSAASDTNGSTYRTVNGNGNGLLDILPEANGRTWNNSAYENFIETEPDTTRIERATSPGGNYTETDTFADTSQPPATIVVEANLSGTYTDAATPGPEGGLSDITIGAPARNGSVSVIPISISESGTILSGDIQDWYPTTTLHSDASELLAAQAIPSACDVPAGIDTTANEISERITRLDPVLGTYESRHNVTYLVPFYGTVCTTFSDVLDDYYDYSGQSTEPFAATPQQITTLVETLGFKSGAIAGASTTRRAASVRDGNPAPAAIGRVAANVGRATFDRVIGRLYRERRIALRSFLRKHIATLRIGR